MKVHIGPYRKNRKISVKIDDYDCWGLEITLAMVIHPALVAFKNQGKPGCPHAFLGEPDTEEGGYTDQSIEEGSRKFDIALDKMIWSFYQLTAPEDNDEPEFPIPTKIHQDIEISDGCIQMGDREYAEGALEKWREEHKTYRDRIQDGLDLFAKHYQTLWN